MSRYLKEEYPEISLEEEKEFYDETLVRIMRNTRYYLDNIEELWVFKCSFLDYHKKKPL